MASTYLNVHDQHPRLSEIEDLIKTNKVTPAEVAEELMKSDDADTSLDGLVNFLRCKNNPTKDKEIDPDADGDQDQKAKELMADDSDIELVTNC